MTYNFVLIPWSAISGKTGETKLHKLSRMAFIKSLCLLRRQRDNLLKRESYWGNRVWIYVSNTGSDQSFSDGLFGVEICGMSQAMYLSMKKLGYQWITDILNIPFSLAIYFNLPRQISRCLLLPPSRRLPLPRSDPKSTSPDIKKSFAPAAPLFPWTYGVLPSLHFNFWPLPHRWYRDPADTHTYSYLQNGGTARMNGKHHKPPSSLKAN